MADVPESPVLTKWAKVAARRTAEEIGAKPFHDGVAVYIIVMDRFGHLSVAVLGQPTLEQTELLVRGAERVRAERSS
jgi:hypothetical protein